jgi:nucleotide-binding universal stress UspA family protein
MYKTIIIPLALDQGLAPRLLELARLLKDDGGKLIAVHVLDQVPKFASYYMGDDAGANRQNEILAAAKQGIVDRIGEQDDAEAVVLTGHPGRSITDYAQEIGADCIIVGSHQPDLTDFFLGSTAARIVRYSPCSVHVLR